MARRTGSLSEVWGRLFSRSRESVAYAEPVPSFAAEGVAYNAGIRNALEIQTFGLRRSGNHALIAWIAQQYSSPIVFLNNARPFCDPFTTHLMGRVPNAVPHRKLNGEEIEKLRLAPKDLLLVSYEDLLLRKLAKMDILPQRQAWLGKSGRICRVLLLRDFYNWIASRIRLLENKGTLSDDVLDKVDHQIRSWSVYAREFVGETKYLGDHTIRVRFDRWADDDSYRLEILDQLGIPVVENSRPIVPKVGGGSSFDGTRFSGNAEAMDILNRWTYLEGLEYRPLLRLFGERRAEIDRYNVPIFAMEYPFRASGS